MVDQQSEVHQFSPLTQLVGFIEPNHMTAAKRSIRQILGNLQEFQAEIDLPRRHRTSDSL